MKSKSTFNVDVFGCKVHVIFCKNITRSINYYFRKYDDGTLSKEPEAYFYFPGAPYTDYYIFFDINNMTTDLFNHEKSHLVEEILIGKGIRPVGEIRAVLDGFISTKMTKILKRRKLRLKMSV